MSTKIYDLLKDGDEYKEGDQILKPMPHRRSRWTIIEGDLIGEIYFKGFYPSRRKSKEIIETERIEARNW